MKKIKELPVTQTKETYIIQRLDTGEFFGSLTDWTWYSNPNGPYGYSSIQMAKHEKEMVQRNECYHNIPMRIVLKRETVEFKELR